MPWFEHARELELLESPKARRDAIECVDSTLRKQTSRLTRIGTVALMAVIVCAAGLLMHRTVGFRLTLFVTGLGGGIAASTAKGFWYWSYRRRAQRLLRDYLCQHGIPVCLHCGYDLRGQTEPRCPECGCEFDPAILNRTDSGGAARNA